MSYKAPPAQSPQSDRLYDSNYGWSNSTSSPGQPNYEQSYAPQHPSHQPFQNTGGPILPPGPSRQPPLDPRGSLNPFALAPEDLNFLRQIRKESWLERTFSWGAYYLYNKKNNLPNQWTRYLFIGVFTYSLGKVLYVPKMRKKLMENPSNTPLMQALKTTYGIIPPGGQAPYNPRTYRPSTPGYYPQTDGSEFNNESWTDTGFINEPHADKPAEDLIINDPFNQNNQDQSTPSTYSYDELRLRNRGLVR